MEKRCSLANVSDRHTYRFHQNREGLTECLNGRRVATLSSIEKDLDTVLISLLQFSTDLLLNTLTGVATAVGELSGQL